MSARPTFFSRIHTIALILLVAATIAPAPPHAHAAGPPFSAGAYADDMKLAQQAVDLNDRDRAMTLLRKHQPQSGVQDLRGFEWRHLLRRCQPNEGKKAGERDETTGLVATNTDSRILFLADSRSFAAQAADGTLRICDSTTLERLHEATGASYPLHLAAGGRMMQVSGYSGLQFWDTRDQVLAPFWLFPRERDWSVSAFTGDARVAAVRFGGGQIQLLDTVNVIKREITNFTAHTGAIRTLCFSPDSERLASAGTDQSVRIWDWARQICLETYNNHTDTVDALAYSPDGRILASAGHDQTILLWNTAAKSAPARLEGHGGVVWNIAFSPDGRTLASGSADNTIKLWNVAAGRVAATLRLTTTAGNDPGKAVVQVAFSPDGNLLAARLHDGTLRMWRASSFE